MKILCTCGIGLSFALAVNSATGAAPDISGTYWATSFSPKIQVVGGGDPPLNTAGKAAYEMNQAGLKDGSVVDKARLMRLVRCYGSQGPCEHYTVVGDYALYHRTDKSALSQWREIDDRLLQLIDSWRAPNQPAQ